MTATHEPLKRVILAISAFRSDAQVMKLLECVYGEGMPFGGVIVVDSLSSGRLEQEIERSDWDVHFWSANENLGAAGNLAKRMELATAHDADWCYALNADGELRLDTIRELLACSAGLEKVGAVYPMRFRPNRGGSWETPRKTFLPLTPPVRLHPPDIDREEVAWSSSNGALYNLEPARRGLYVWTDLWMGWEDLAYGWILSQAGWKQIYCANAKFADPYEHRQVRILNRDIYIHDKPPWISYYTTRNLGIFVSRSGAGAKGWAVVAWRALQEIILTVLFKDRKSIRIRNIIWGVLDSILGKTGMVLSPDRS